MWELIQTTMTGLFAVIGMIAVIIGIFYAVDNWYWNRQDRKEQSEPKKTESLLKKYRSDLFADGYWFSEDLPTMNLLHRLNVNTPLDQAREFWRLETAKERRGESVPIFIVAHRKREEEFEAAMEESRKKRALEKVEKDRPVLKRRKSHPTRPENEVRAESADPRNSSDFGEWNQKG